MYKTLVSFDGSNFSFFFRTPVVRIGKKNVGAGGGNLQRIILFLFFLPQDTHRICISIYVPLVFGFSSFFLWCCKRKRRIFLWNLATAGLLHTMISLFDSHESCFGFSPPCQVPPSPALVKFAHSFGHNALFWSFLAWD